ncbi:MAG: flippase [Yoonia sp.]
MTLIPSFILQRLSHRPNLIKIVDNIGWLFFDKVLRMGVGLFLGIWIARYLGPEKFGLWNFALALVGLFSSIASMGLQGIVVRDIVRAPDQANVTLGTTAALLLLGGAVSYILLLITILILRPDDTMAKAIVAVLGSIVLFKGSEIAIYWFESQILSKYIIWLQNSSFLVFAAIKVVLVLQNAPLIAFALATTFEALVIAFLMLVMLGSRGLRLRQLQVALPRAKSLLKDSWPLLLSSIAIIIYMKIDQIMLGQMTGDEAVGTYSVAVRISEVWYFVSIAIVASVFPAILNAKKQNENLYLQRLQRLYDLMVLLSVAVALPMTVLSTSLVTVLFGDPYAEAGGILAIHIWASIFVFLGVASSRWFLVENLQILSLQRTVMGAMINIFLNMIMIPKFGALGAAWATVISQFSVGILLDALQKRTRTMFVMKVRAFNPLKSIGRIKQGDS